MSFVRSFAGSFYSPDVYSEARNASTGWAFRYALKTFLVITPPAIAIIVLSEGPERFSYPDPELNLLQLGVIVGIALGLRLLMLLLLAIVAQLLALIIKPRIGYRSGLTLGALAYTPVALFDALVFILAGVALHPGMLLLCSCFMLIAALKASK